MRSHLTVALLAILLGLVPAGTTAGAQVGTPAPAATPDGGQATAPLELTDPDGVELGTIELVELLDPFEDVDPGFTPDEGMRPVMALVRFENTGSGPLDVRPNHIALQDTDGFVWTSSTVRRPDDVATPDLPNVRIAPGDRVSGMIGFQIPVNSSVGAVLYRPENSRFLTVASIATMADSGLGSAVTYEIAEPNASGQVTVSELVDPFEDFPPDRAPQPDTRYVLVTVIVENVGATPLQINPGMFSVQDETGTIWSYSNVPRGQDVVIPDLQGQQLAPGSRISGVVGFTLPADIEVVSVLFMPESGRVLTLHHVEP